MMGLFANIFGRKKSRHAVPYLAVATGTLMPIEASDDPVFAQKMMGDGYMIMPSENTIVAPVSGVVQTLFPTLHAIGIVADNGDEVVIHVGFETVQLKGEGFQAFVQVGDRVEAGQKLLEVDFSAIRHKVPSIGTPVVITNIGTRRVQLTGNDKVAVNDVAMTII
jgi:PTS system D-glucosamine-specific IIC component